jgi:NhaP-type Na+/H+ and K+/H+ antiporter
VQLLAAWVPVHLVGKPVRDLAIPGEIRVALLVRMGKGIVPVSGTPLEKDDQLFVVIHQTAVEKFQRMMGWKS